MEEKKRKKKLVRNINLFYDIEKARVYDRKKVKIFA